MHRSARRISDLAVEGHELSVSELVERYGVQWMATARRCCASAVDADDAYQRGLEVLLTKPPLEDDPERIAAWVHTVVRNEALQIIRSRRHESDQEFEQIAEQMVSGVAIPEELVVDGERHGIAKEALRRLRPDQVRCLLLRADGFDYPEICRITGFSYAKVNRLLSEGRKAARLRSLSIDEGRECQRITPLLSAIVDGEADDAAMHDASLHLENCVHCRATLREYTLTQRDLASVFPLGVALASSGAAEGPLARAVEHVTRLYEIVVGRVATVTDVQVVTAKKGLAIVAATATVVGGGAAIHRVAEGGGDADAPAGKGPASLVVPIDLPRVKRADDARDRDAKARGADRDTPSAGDTARSVVADPQTQDAEPLGNETGAGDDGFAADPTDTNVDGTGEDNQAGTLAP